MSSLHLSKAGEPREGERKNDDDEDDDAQKGGTFRNQEAVELGLYRSGRLGFSSLDESREFWIVKHLTDKYEMRANYDRLSMHGGLRFNA